MAETNKLHVKKGDKVVVIAGKDKGREGKVLKTEPPKSRVFVEGINTVQRHTKPTQASPQGGIVSKEAPLSSSNVMVICPSCSKPTRIKKTRSVDGKNTRACKKCGEIIESGK